MNSKVIAGCIGVAAIVTYVGAQQLGPVINARDVHETYAAIDRDMGTWSAAMRTADVEDQTGGDAMRARSWGMEYIYPVDVEDSELGRMLVERMRSEPRVAQR